MSSVRLFPMALALLVAMLLGEAPGAGAPASEPRPEPMHELTLLTYNLNYGNPDPRATLDAIAAADADVVLLQEITAEWQHALVAHFAAQYPHRVFRIHARAAGGLAVLSKVPVRDETLLPCPERGWFPAQLLVLDSPVGPIQILHVHLRPAIDRGSWIRGFLTTRPIRRREIEAYWKQLGHELPTIVAGDFNEEPSGRALRFLRDRGLTRVPARGPATWHYARRVGGRLTDLLKLDLDHVMLDAQLVGRDGQVLDAGTSDHRPVLVTIARPGTVSS